MMCAWSVSRSINALHSRGLGITCDHLDNGRLVVTITAAFSARSAITWFPSTERAAELVGVRGLGQFVDQRGRGGEPHPPPLTARSDTKSGSQMGFSGASFAHKQDWFGFGHI